MDPFSIDPEAKCKVDLIKIRQDTNGHPYFIGKLQFPGTLDFEAGASFMVFVSQDGVEELQIAPLDPARRSKSRSDSANLSGSRLVIDLHQMKDQNGDIYYIGEALGLLEMDLRRGIFFTVFTSKAGEEELQISRLNHQKLNRRRRFRDDDDIEYDDVNKDIPVETRSIRAWAKS